MTSSLLSRDTRPILFYDGNCGLCSRVVRWCLRHDRRRRLRYAPLQGSTYASIDDATKPPDMDTVVLVDADGFHVRSDAIVRMLRAIGGPWTVAAWMLRILPRRLRDAGYRFVARRRLKWFGVADRCDLPGPFGAGTHLP